METNSTYYIYNFSVQPELLFRDESDVDLFLSKINMHLSPCGRLEKLAISSTSFHACVTFKSLEELKNSLSRPRFNSTKILSQQIGNIFNAYAQAYNSKHLRTGNLFRKGFKQLELVSMDEFDILISEIETEEKLQYIYN